MPRAETERRHNMWQKIKINDRRAHNDDALIFINYPNAAFLLHQDSGWAENL